MAEDHLVAQKACIFNSSSNFGMAGGQLEVQKTYTFIPLPSANSATALEMRIVELMCWSVPGFRSDGLRYCGAP